MKTKLFMAFVAVLFAATFASCNKDDDVTLESEYAEELDNHGQPFPFDESGRPYGYGGISEENFNKHIAGKGWKCEGTWVINDDGTRQKTDYNKDMYGASPTDYYFASDGTGKAFTIIDATGKSEYTAFNWSFKYDKNMAETSCIVTDHGFMQVVGWSQGVLCVIKPLYSQSSGKTTYGVAIYKEMSDKELASYNEKYSAANPEPSEKQYTVNDVKWYRDCPMNVYKVTNPTFYVYEGRQTDGLAFVLYGLLSMFDARYNDPMYIATTALVADSISTDEALRVPNLRLIKVQGSFFVEDVITPDELNYMLNEAPIGEKMTFGIYLLNDERKALQKIDVTFVKVEKANE